MNIERLLKLSEFFEYAAKNEPQYIYHIKPEKLKGNFLHSLSELEKVYPDIYKVENKKYKNREKHINQKIDLLDCQWKDCVNFSTLNPAKIFQLLQLLEIPGYDHNDKIEIFKFDINKLKDFDMCFYDDKSSANQNSYSKVKNYKESKFIPIETVKYFIKCKEKKEYPLIFGDILHILIKGKVPINLAKIEKFEL